MSAVNEDDKFFHHTKIKFIIYYVVKQKDKYKYNIDQNESRFHLNSWIDKTFTISEQLKTMT